MALSDTPRPRPAKVRKHGEGSIFQRASDGLWVATVVFTGKEHRFTSKLQNKAIAKRKEWLRLRQAGVRPSSDKETVGEWLNPWLREMCEPRLSVWGPPWISRRPVVTSPATLPRPNSCVVRGSPRFATCGHRRRT